MRNLVALFHADCTHEGPEIRGEGPRKAVAAYAFIEVALDLARLEVAARYGTADQGGAEKGLFREVLADGLLIRNDALEDYASLLAFDLKSAK